MASRSGDGCNASDRPGERTRRPSAEPASPGRERNRQLTQRSAGRRVADANARDAAAQERDIAAQARDAAADLRDRKWEARHPRLLDDGRAATGAEILLRAAKHRSEAAADRAAASLARAAAAAERQQAAADREQAAHDRELAQLDRDAMLQELSVPSSTGAGDELAPPSGPGARVLRVRQERVADGWRETFWRVFGLSQNPMMLLDQDRRIVALNTALVEALGYSREQMIGLRLDTFFDQIEWQFLDARWRAFQREGTFNGDRTMVHADGDRVKVQYAAHWAQIAGRNLALYVALNTSAERRAPKTASLQSGESLSPRELEVLGWVAMGRRAYEIAAELGIASTTVESHVRSAMRKVGARSQAQLVAVACAHGLLDLSAVVAVPVSS